MKMWEDVCQFTLITNTQKGHTETNKQKTVEGRAKKGNSMEWWPALK